MDSQTMSKADYYETLGVSQDADEKALKSAFRKLAMQYHPDRNPGDTDAEQRFKEVNEAYEALKDPQKRAAYDRFGHAAFEQGGGGGPFNGRGAGGFSDIFEDIFGEMMGGARARQAQRSGQGSDLRYNMEITLEEAYHGKTAVIDLPTAVTCTVCDGEGTKPGTELKTCPTCVGAGRVRASQGFFSIERTCPTCDGRGQVISDPCDVCGGAGRVPEERSLQVNIPVGIEEGTRIRLPKEGNAGMNGGEPGDLYIFVSIAQHEFFQREGADLLCTVPISMTTAALGGEIDVVGLDGATTRVKIPEGTQHGKRFRLRGKGMPVLRSPQMGDLYIHVTVETPQKLTRRMRELLQEFDSLSSDANSPQSSGFFGRMKGFFDTLGE